MEMGLGGGSAAQFFLGYAIEIWYITPISKGITWSS
jgi:hypothetical protein